MNDSLVAAVLFQKLSEFFLMVSETKRFGAAKFKHPVYYSYLLTMAAMVNLGLSLSDHEKITYLLECDTIQSCRYTSMFRRSLFPPSSGYKNILAVNITFT
jgi:hypothetical protein